MKQDKTTFSILALVAALAILAGCNENAIEPSEPRLVVEGWIESGGYPTVLLTTTVTPHGDGTKISDCVVRWGKVTVSDGDTTVILTGGVDNRYFPPFKYSSTAIKGVVGKTYTLTAEYNGMKVSASTRILPPVSIDSITVTPIAGNDTLRSTKVFLTSNGPATQYYKLRCRVAETDKVFYSSFLGTFSDEGRKGKIEMPLYRGKRIIDKRKYIQQLVAGNHAEVQLCHIDETAFNFWSDYDNVVTFGTNSFLPSETIVRSNIVGGYGYWCGYGVSNSGSFVVP